MRAASRREAKTSVDASTIALFLLGRHEAARAGDHRIARPVSRATAQSITSTRRIAEHHILRLPESPNEPLACANETPSQMAQKTRGQFGRRRVQFIETLPRTSFIAYQSRPSAADGVCSGTIPDVQSCDHPRLVAHMLDAWFRGQLVAST